MEFGSIQLTAKGWEVLKGDLEFRGELDLNAETVPSVQEPQKLADLDYDRELFEILRQTRKELADESGVPPFVIFADKTLVEMATYFPQSGENFLNIHGIGKVKAEKFGTLFMPVIEAYCRDKGILEKPKHTDQPAALKPDAAEAPAAKAAKPRYITVGELFNSGRSIGDIMDLFGIRQTTVIDHLVKFARDGFGLPGDELLKISSLPDDQIERVLEAFNQCGNEYLKPAFDFLNGTVQYEELNILRLYHLSQQNGS